MLFLGFQSYLLTETVFGSLGKLRFGPCEEGDFPKNENEKFCISSFPKNDRATLDFLGESGRGSWKFVGFFLPEKFRWVKKKPSVPYRN